jgi:hypothetical protein
LISEKSVHPTDAIAFSIATSIRIRSKVTIVPFLFWILYIAIQVHDYKNTQDIVTRENYETQYIDIIKDVKKE